MSRSSRLRVSSFEFRVKRGTRNPEPGTRNVRCWLAIGGLAVGLVLAVGCTPQLMTDQPRYDPLAASAFFPDGAVARPLPPETVARGTIKDDPHLYTGKINDQHVTTFPEPVTMDTLKRGQERYNIFCAACHGELGAGAGLVAQRGYPGVVGLHQDRLRQASVGYLFDVATNGTSRDGVQRMPPYGHLLTAQDRWAIVAYIRALQLSQDARIDDVPAEERANLEAGGRQQ